MSLFSDAMKWSQITGQPLWQMLVKSALGPLLMGNRLLNWDTSEKKRGLPWVTPEAKRWMKFGGRSQGIPINRDVWPPSKRMQVHSIRTMCAVISAGYFNEYSGLFFSHPYSSERLIRFVLSLPMDQLNRPGESRSLLRRSTVGLLPERVRTRVSKGVVVEAFSRAVAREENKLGDVRDFEVCRRGYARAAGLAEAIRLTALGSMEHSGQLLRLISVERWLRSLNTIGNCERASLEQRDALSLTG